MSEHSARRPPARLPAPGWLPDPSVVGATRYWDGRQWTDQTRGINMLTDADEVRIRRAVTKGMIYAFLIWIGLGVAAALAFALVSMLIGSAVFSGLSGSM
ncbi:MAG: DUF2510 domain-containing protein [Demequina sp.]|nr:DUF2510 domain-containing protein [Demequina sp.]